MHTLELTTIFPSGAEEWECRDCDRHLLILVWHPDARQIVVNAGDEQVEHEWEETSDD